MAGNSSRFAKALRSAAEGFAAEVATSSICLKAENSRQRMVYADGLSTQACPNLL
jgi:hypothetical protein